VLHYVVQQSTSNLKQRVSTMKTPERTPVNMNPKYRPSKPPTYQELQRSLRIINRQVTLLFETLECHPGNDAVMKAGEVSASSGQGDFPSYHTLVCITPPEVLNPILDNLYGLV